jgi:hypothetical protein
VVGLLVLESEELDVDESLNVMIFGGVDYEGVEISLASGRGLRAGIVED